jgi:hypothetical protein
LHSVLQSPASKCFLHLHRRGLHQPDLRVPLFQCNVLQTSNQFKRCNLLSLHAHYLPRRIVRNPMLSSLRRQVRAVRPATALPQSWIPSHTVSGKWHHNVQQLRALSVSPTTLCLHDCVPVAVPPILHPHGYRSSPPVRLHSFARRTTDHKLSVGRLQRGPNGSTALTIRAGVQVRCVQASGRRIPRPQS